MTRNPVSVETPGDRIKRLRESAGYSQMRLCRVTGISQATLYRAEVGGVVTVKTAKRVAAVLGCAPEDLMPRDGSVHTTESPR